MTSLKFTSTPRCSTKISHLSLVSQHVIENKHLASGQSRRVKRRRIPIFLSHLILDGGTGALACHLGQGEDGLICAPAELFALQRIAFTLGLVLQIAVAASSSPQLQQCSGEPHRWKLLPSNM